MVDFAGSDSLLKPADYIAYPDHTSACRVPPPPVGNPAVFPAGTPYPLPKKSLTKLLGPTVDPAGTWGGHLLRRYPSFEGGPGFFPQSD